MIELFGPIYFHECPLFPFYFYFKTISMKKGFGDLYRGIGEVWLVFAENALLNA